MIIFLNSDHFPDKTIHFPFLKSPRVFARDNYVLSKPDYKQKEFKMKRFLLIIITLVGLATGKLFAQNFSNSATPASVAFSSSSSTVALSSTISGTYNGNTSYAFANPTSWAGPSGITVGATALSGSNKIATATATLPANLAAGTYTFTITYSTNRGGTHNGTQTVTVTVYQPSVSLSPSPLTITPGSVSLTASANSFSGTTGNYGFSSWSASPSTGVTLPGSSSSSSSSTTKKFLICKHGYLYYYSNCNTRYCFGFCE